MKKAFIMCVALVAMSFTLALGNDLDMEAINKKIAKSDEEIANPKKNIKPKTWITRGEMFLDIADENMKGLWVGMTKTELKLLAKGKPKVSTETVNGVAYEVHTYPTKKLYFNGEKLEFYKETQMPVENALGKAREAIDKAIELDQKGSEKKKIKEVLNRLYAKGRAEGINAFTGADYQLAHDYLALSVEASMNPAVGNLDTVIVYYAGIISNNEQVKDYPLAVKLFQICIDNGFYDKGNVYTNLAYAYKQLGDSVAQEQALIKGFSAFPTSQSIVVELINMYLSSGDDPMKVMPYLRKAQENEPTNASLFFAEAALYEKLEKKADAERMYLKTMEVDPKFYNAYYNLGALYYNQGVEYFKQADAIKDWRSPEIKVLEEKGNAEFKKAIDPFVKAHELDPSDRFSLENIKNLYYRFRTESPEMQAQYDKYNDMLQKFNETAPAAQQ